ncbi:P-loop containing nucleoside triphosphate hydrolase protein [Chytriomyces sp. MP71]|nr:P-loop containing nucleoside triphosphate hydrolase protein [Chytriomyces sp. MP71]
MVWAVSAGNFMTEMLVYENLENLSDEDGAPVLALPALLGGADDLSGGSVYEGRCGEEEKDAFAKKRVVEESALALCLKGGKGFRLVHGVFGSGKTYLIAVTVIFLQRAVEEGLLGHIPDFRIAISSMSNVAVDQILQTLVSLGFENFVRVGSIKKIAKPLLPYTLQQIKNANEDLKELRSMLKGDSLDAAARRGVQEAMKRFTENKNRNLLDTSFVVASTCAACAFESLDLFRATILILDECSQMTEPLSLLPILRFNPQLSLLIGDPLQLAPTLETGSVDPRSSLDCTLYERMVALGRESIMLRVQYRCAKKIAQISNRLFYGGVLEHGCEEEKTGPAVERLPTTLFIDVSGRGGESRGGGGAGGGSLVNISEVEVVNRIVQGLIDSGQVEGTKIGVITYCESVSPTIIFQTFIHRQTASRSHTAEAFCLVRDVNRFRQHGRLVPRRRARRNYH